MPVCMLTPSPTYDRPSRGMKQAAAAPTAFVSTLFTVRALTHAHAHWGAEWHIQG